jgi:hypothetical protein
MCKVLLLAVIDVVAIAPQNRARALPQQSLGSAQQSSVSSQCLQAVLAGT